VARAVRLFAVPGVTFARRGAFKWGGILTLQTSETKKTSDRVIAVLQKTLMLDRGRFVPSALLVDDLGVSSLDRFELLMDLEQEFSIDFSETELVSVRTVGDLIEHIERQTKPA
jgi:acyl carrier protein